MLASRGELELDPRVAGRRRGARQHASRRSPRSTCSCSRSSRPSPRRTRGASRGCCPPAGSPRPCRLPVVSGDDRPAERPGGRDPGDAGDPRRGGERREGGPAAAGEAADAGAELAVLPECFVSIYPSNAWAQRVGLVRRLGRAVGADVAQLGGRPRPAGRRARGSLPPARASTPSSAATNSMRAPGVHTIYNTMLTIGDERPASSASTASCGRPSSSRLFWGQGAGRRPSYVHETAVGRVGGLICGEHVMTLARYALYRQGAQIWVGADGGRLRRLGRAHAGDRDRVRRVRRRGAAVHPARRVPGRLPGRRCPTARCSGAAAR